MNTFKYEIDINELSDLRQALFSSIAMLEHAMRQYDLNETSYHAERIKELNEIEKRTRYSNLRMIK